MACTFQSAHSGLDKHVGKWRVTRSGKLACNQWMSHETNIITIMTSDSQDIICKYTSQWLRNRQQKGTCGINQLC